MRLKALKQCSIALTICGILTACTVTPSRYQIHQDVAPNRLPSANEIKDITPQNIPYSRGGNKDYTVRGINYQVLESHENYVQTGIASWYGAKFHGHLTSNGEIYDMYSLSAAHKSLPIPSFAKITNLENNKHTIVRVNDRGPFHPNRLIDLSYGAAFKLDVLKQGTARVKIESITFPNANGTPMMVKQGCNIQLLALQNKSVIEQQLIKVKQLYRQPAHVEQATNMYRLKLGPIESLTQCELLHKKVLINYPKAFIKSL